MSGISCCTVRRIAAASDTAERQSPADRRAFSLRGLGRLHSIIGSLAGSTGSPCSISRCCHCSTLCRHLSEHVGEHSGGALSCLALGGSSGSTGSEPGRKTAGFAPQPCSSSPSSISSAARFFKFSMSSIPLCVGDALLRALNHPHDSDSIDLRLRDAFAQAPAVDQPASTEANGGDQAEHNSAISQRSDHCPATMSIAFA